MKEGTAVFDSDRMEDLQYSTEKQILDRKSARIKAANLAPETTEYLFIRHERRKRVCGK